MQRLNDFHLFCSNVEANQEVLQFSQANADQIDQPPLDIIQDEFIELSDYSIKTENYIVTLSQNVLAQQQHQTDPITNITFLDDTATVLDGKIIQPIVAHIDISLKKNDDAEVVVEKVPAKNRVPNSKLKSKRTWKKIIPKIVTDGKCDGEMAPQTIVSDTEFGKDHVDAEIVDLIERIDEDFDDDEEADDVVETVVYESHEQFAGFPKVIIKDSRLHIRGSALLDLMSR